MKTYRKFLAEGLLSGYKHTVENLAPAQYKERHVFTHKDHQFVITVSDKNHHFFDSKHAYMNVKARYLPTGRTLIDTTYNTNKHYPSGSLQWNKSVSGTYFSGNKIDDVKRNKIVKNLISHVNKHIGIAKFSTNIDDHISQTDVEDRTDYRRSQLDENALQTAFAKTYHESALGVLTARAFGKGFHTYRIIHSHVPGKHLHTQIAFYAHRNVSSQRPMAIATVHTPINNTQAQTMELRAAF